VKKSRNHIPRQIKPCVTHNSTSKIDGAMSEIAMRFTVESYSNSALAASMSRHSIASIGSHAAASA
jgi:hypothetical protein